MAKKLKNIPAKAHPAHYMMHKYWGRKSHNVISEYIKNYSKEGEIVLDPFMGSGVVIIESLKLNRFAYGIDLNPLSKFITQNSVESIDISNFEKIFFKIFLNNLDKFENLYNTNCPNCNSKSTLLNSVYEVDKIIRVKGKCNNCGIFRKDADQSDFNSIKKSNKLFNQYLKNNLVKFPDDEILQYVKRSGKTHINQLFTKRALLILSSIREDILIEKNRKIRNILMMCFSSMLPNVSKMIPGDVNTINGKSGWQISKIWVPGIHTEKNIFESFLSRFKKIKKGKEETNFLINTKSYKLLNKSSEFLSNIKSNSIDYIFTDPPYGDSIAYLGLSMFFNAWLGDIPQYSKEIIFDPYRNKKHDDYSKRLSKVFLELNRILKPGRFLSFTFHNRDLLIWKAVIDALNNAGFIMKNLTYQEQAVASGTQGINYKNTFRGDFVYNFYKPINSKDRILKIHKPLNPVKLIKAKIKRMFKKNDFITSDYLYETMIPYIVKNNIYEDNDSNPIDLECILSIDYEYTESLKEKNIFGWQKKIN